MTQRYGTLESLSKVILTCSADDSESLVQIVS